MLKYNQATGKMSGNLSVIRMTNLQQEQTMTDINFEIKGEACFRFEENERREAKIPPLQGDYAKTLFLSRCTKPHSILKNDDYARYFVYECGIRDCSLYHQQLIDEGFFEEANLRERLNTFKLPELKELLKQLQQPVSGRKAVLIDRIIERADEEFIEKNCPEKVYKLSKDGWNFLNEHEAYIELHRHSLWGISWQTYDKYARRDRDFLSTAWIILNEQLKSADIREMRNIYHSLYALLMEQGKRSDALETLLRVFYLDLCGINVMPLIKWYREGNYTKDRLKGYGPAAMRLAPGLYSALANFKDVYYSEMIDILYTWELQLRLCSKELFREIIEDAIYEKGSLEQARNKLQAVYDQFVDGL